MNFKTTLALLLVLALVGVYLLISHDHVQQPVIVPTEKSLLDLNKSSIDKLTITSADGKVVSLEKTDGRWRIMQPVQANADTFAVDGVLEAMVNLKGTSEVSGDDASKTGVDHPQFSVELSSAGKTSKLLVGDTLAVGNSVYVKSADAGKVAVVSAELLTKLQQPVSDLRDKKLVDVATNDIKQFSIERKGQRLTMVKHGTDWQITEPTTMPADTSAVSDLLMGVSGLRAEDWRDTGSVISPLVPASLKVSFSTAEASTQPATTATSQPANQTNLTFGRAEDLQNKRVYVQAGDSPALALVATSSLEAFNKKPLDLRDKKVLDIDPKQVTRLEVSVAGGTEAVQQQAISRRQIDPVLGPPVPTSAPAATSHATSQASSQPRTAPASQWVVDGANRPADDAKVAAILDALHPLNAEKFLESSPATTQPNRRCTIRIISAGKTEELTLVDPGKDQPIIASYNGLLFEVSRVLWTDAIAELRKQ